MEEQVDVSKILKLSEKVTKVCRLFAEDNITVRFNEKAKTASFAPFSNVLELPYNIKILSDDDICILFISHEVGHARWTSIDAMKKTNALGIPDEHNIVEDIRIERKTKQEYPGLIGAFSRGYAKLTDDGFFGKVNRWNFLPFSDRLNIYAKVGPIIAKGITFTEAEMEFYKRCMAAETEDEVIELSKELKVMSDQSSVYGKLLGMSWDEIQEKFEDEIKKYEDGLKAAEDEDTEDNSSDAQNDDNDLEYFDDSTHEVDNEIREFDDEEREEFLKRLAEKLERQDIKREFDNKINSLNLSGVSFHQYECADTKEIHIFTANDFIQNFLDGYPPAYRDCSRTVEYIQSLQKSVDYMARQFEMKKAAARIKHAKIANTGKINLDRVCQYKVTDEIFGKKLVLKDTKRHGMVLLIDASGSMDRQLRNVIRQTILLTEYAKKIGVPFKVYMFGGDIHGKYVRNVSQEYADNHHKPGFAKYSMSGTTRWNGYQRDIFEVMNSDLSKKDYIFACHALINKYGYHLSGTPTAWALGILEKPMAEFFETHNVDIKKLFLITDGEPSDVHYSSKNTVYVDKETNMILRSENQSRFFSIEVLGQIFNRRYGIDMSTIFLTSRLSEWDVSTFINTETSKAKVFLEGKPFFSKHKYIKGEDAAGNGLFFLKPANSDTDINLDSISSDSSVASATTAFKKAVSGMKVSQTMLQALSDEFAV